MIKLKEIHIHSVSKRILAFVIDGEVHRGHILSWNLGLGIFQ
jgi:hypothetical protein